MTDQHLLSGYGQFHTNEADPLEPNKRLQPYTPITMVEVRQVVDNPPTVPKANARWFVPSTLPRRNAAAQEQAGSYWALWADMDKGHLPPVAEVLEAVQNEVIGLVQVEVYNTRSATAQRKKARIIVPLSQPLSGVDFLDCPRVFNAQLTKAGFTPDPANVGAAQLCYLPNRGEFYEAANDRQSDLFDPMEGWADHLHEIRQKAAISAAEALRKAAEAKRKRAERTSFEDDPIAAFNADYSVEELLFEQGYEQNGDTFRHPGSESGSFSASVKDGRVHSLSSSDPLYTGGSGGGAHDAFSVYTVLWHGGNRDAALRDAADNWLKIGGESWNRVKQREWALTGAWPQLVDPYGQFAAPAFPLDALPPPMADLCQQLADQSGFDAGGYAFSYLIAASALIDQQARMTAGPLNVPPQLWGGLVAPSGGGKSPIMREATSAARALNDEVVQESSRLHSKWADVCQMQQKGQRPPDKPLWGQVIVSDTTVEGLGKLLMDNPQGLFMYADEMTEFIGRMDAYGGKGGDKDRGAYLRAFDGGSITVNRAGSHPLVVPNFSLGILAGIQPEKLADLFKKSGGGADGLYQRFLMYSIRPAGAVDYGKQVSGDLREAVDKAIRSLRDSHFMGADAKLDPAAIPLMQAYHQSARDFAQRHGARRFAEHVDKFPGFLARIALTLHWLEQAFTGGFSAVVRVDTFTRAQRIAKCLFEHSRTVYDVLDMQAGEVNRLARSACDAVLSQEWAEFNRGDLTRQATGWRDVADERMSESAITLLIELGWLKDITPAIEIGKRGRRSAGRFVVNPAAHRQFKPHAERLKVERAEKQATLRHLAIAGGV